MTDEPQEPFAVVGEEDTTESASQEFERRKDELLRITNECMDFLQEAIAPGGDTITSRELSFLAFICKEMSSHFMKGAIAPVAENSIHAAIGGLIHGILERAQADDADTSEDQNILHEMFVAGVDAANEGNLEDVFRRLMDDDKREGDDA